MQSEDAAAKQVAAEAPGAGGTVVFSSLILSPIILSYETACWNHKFVGCYAGGFLLSFHEVSKKTCMYLSLFNAKSFLTQQLCCHHKPPTHALSKHLQESGVVDTAPWLPSRSAVASCCKSTCSGCGSLCAPARWRIRLGTRWLGWLRCAQEQRGQGSWCLQRPWLEIICHPSMECAPDYHQASPE